jgi:HK97 family phage portal protein
MWVIKWRSYDGIFGLDSVRLAREAIGLSMAGEKMAGNIYKSGTSINGYLSTEGTLSDEAREILRKEWSKNFSGTRNAGSVAVLTANLKYNPIQHISAQEAQLIDNRNFQISEICRMFGVQPIMVYHYLNATTYASVEQMFLSHIVHTMTPWYRLIEASANKNLLTDTEFHKGYYFKFFEQGMLRGDMAAMAAWFKSNIEHGIMSPNDCRELLDMNPYNDGDIFLVPLNMATPKQVEEQAELQKRKLEHDMAMDKQNINSDKSGTQTNKNPEDSEDDTSKKKDDDNE